MLTEPERKPVHTLPDVRIASIVQLLELSEAPRQDREALYDLVLALSPRCGRAVAIGTWRLQPAAILIVDDPELLAMLAGIFARLA